MSDPTRFWQSTGQSKPSWSGKGQVSERLYRAGAPATVGWYPVSDGNRSCPMSMFTLKKLNMAFFEQMARLREIRVDQDAGVSAKETFSQILICLSNQTRREIIRDLAKPRTYTQLMKKLEINPDSQTGLLNYHLRKMRLTGVIKRTRDGYKLTDLGDAASTIIESLESRLETREVRERMEVKVEPYLEGSLSPRALNRAKQNGAALDERYISGRRTEGVHKHIFADLGVSATQIAKVGSRLPGVLPAFTATLHREKAGEGRYAVCEPGKDRPANWIGGSFCSPWIDPDFAEQEEQVERELVRSFVEHCRKAGAAEILAEEIPVEDETFLGILNGSGFRDYRRAAYLTLKLRE